MLNILYDKYIHRISYLSQEQIFALLSIKKKKITSAAQHATVYKNLQWYQSMVLILVTCDN